MAGYACSRQVAATRAAGVYAAGMVNLAESGSSVTFVVPERTMQVVGETERTVRYSGRNGRCRRQVVVFCSAQVGR